MDYPRARSSSRVANPRIEPLGLAMPGVPPSVEAVVTKALAPEPRERYATAEEMRGRLMSCMLEIDPAAGPESMSQFMRVVFSTEYSQERRLIQGLRQAATAVEERPLSKPAVRVQPSPAPRGVSLQSNEDTPGTPSARCHNQAERAHRRGAGGGRGCV